MAEIRAWALTLCTVALGCALAQMLVPKGGLGRLFRLILSAFFLCSLLAPLLRWPALLVPSETSAPVTDEAALRRCFYEELKKEADAELTQRVTLTLRAYGIDLDHAETDMYISQEGDIYMRRIILYLDKQNIAKASTARVVVKEQWNLPVSIEET